MAPHTRGSTPSLNIADEFANFSLNGAAFRAIPDVALDDESWMGSSVTKALHPATVCGLSGSLDARMTDCGEKWDGQVLGNSGESLWRLVTRTAAGNEVWRDERTELLWSDNLGTTTWCRASGNAQNSNGVDCATSGLGGQSWCTDDALFPDAKGNLLGADGVRWRLTTLSDLKLGDVDGLRFVLPRVDWFWAATTRSDLRGEALVFNGWEGYINFSARGGTQTVRCVGVTQPSCSASNGVASTLLPSSVSRDRGAQLKLSQEFANYSLSGSSYRAIPDVTKDDDGFMGTSVLKAPHTVATCGTTGTVDQRIASCAFRWDGAANGIGSEGTWTLVTRGGGFEVWRDDTTQLLWSDSLGNANWCNASGNRQNLAGIDCSTLGTQSLCTDDTLVPAAKGNLTVAERVRWRLPTLNDFKLADVLGYRFVPSSPGAMWTATVRSSQRSQAYVFNGAQGNITFPARSGSQQVRCVGAVLPATTFCPADGGVVSDGGTRDGGDGGLLDAGASDAGDDAGLRDAGADDGGANGDDGGDDAGLDGGVDGGRSDAGSDDAGTDAGLSANQTDAGDADDGGVMLARHGPYGVGCACDASAFDVSWLFGALAMFGLRRFRKA